jgi:hypothetical protein
MSGSMDDVMAQAVAERAAAFRLEGSAFGIYVKRGFPSCLKCCCFVTSAACQV